MGVGEGHGDPVWFIKQGREDSAYRLSGAVSQSDPSSDAGLLLAGCVAPHLSHNLSETL